MFRPRKNKPYKRYEPAHPFGKGGYMHTILRWPLLWMIGCILIFELILYFSIRIWVVGWEYTYFIRLLTYRKALKLIKSLKLLHNAKDYKTWEQAALTLDSLQKKDSWKMQEESPFYDRKVIKTTVLHLNKYIRAGDTKKLLQILPAACRSNLGGINNGQLYSFSFIGTKYLIHEYVERVVEALHHVSRSELPPEEKRAFYKTVMKTYGRTALCLSGGAAMSYYHLGVVKCLLERGLLPQVISGTSGGSLISALICVRTDEELKEILNPEVYKNLGPRDPEETVWFMFKRFLKEGVMFDKQRWIKKLQWVTKGSTTFLEAYKRTGRILNITVIPEKKHSPPILLNYKTAPNVVIYSAILASSSIPGLIHPVELIAKTDFGLFEPFHGLGKRWRDGSFKTDIPTQALHQLFKVNFTIVSQVNPHIVLFFFDPRGSIGLPSQHRQGYGWRGGFIASTLEHFLKLDMVKWLLLLKNLDLIPSMLGEDSSQVFLQKFDGTVTIKPRPKLEDYINLIANPTHDSMTKKIQGGQEMTWPKLAMISNRMRIEATINQCWEQLPEKVKQENTSMSQESLKLVPPTL